MDEPPAGYRPAAEFKFLLNTGFNAALGALFYRENQDGLSLAVRLGPAQLNPVGMAHGGMVAALADLTLGGTIFMRRLAPHGMATVSLNIDYMDAGREGDWLECRTMLNRTGKSMIFGTAMLTVGDRPVAHASGVFKLFSPKG